MGGLIALLGLVACGEQLSLEPSPTDDAGTSTGDGGHQGSDDASGADGGLPPGAKRVFVTKATYNGDLGGVAGADDKCRAAAAALGGSWVAWLSADSPSTNPQRRIRGDGPWYRTDGAEVFTNKEALFNAVLQHPISFTEEGLELPDAVNERVWTATTSAGAPGPFSRDCFEWGSTHDEALVGSPGEQGVKSTEVEQSSCDELAHLYCFEL